MTITLPTELMEKLSKLGENTDKMCEIALKAGGEVVKAAMKSKLSAVVGHGTEYPSRSTGQLVSAIGVSPMKVARDGTVDVRIGFSENRSDGKPNAMLAVFIEHGRTGQPGKPFKNAAKTAARSGAIAAMTAAFDAEIGKL